MYDIATQELVEGSSLDDNLFLDHFRKMSKQASTLAMESM